LDGEKFPIVELSGTYAEIGFQHGFKLRDRIKKAIKFYSDVTKTLNDREREENIKVILEYAKHFREIIKEQNPNFAIEIEEIAKGAEVDPLWIYVINSRSEIMSNMEKGSTECTALYFKEIRALAQNWDWAADLEDLAVIMKIKLDSGVEILQVTEPGMLGKIGFNNYGLGILLNFLHVERPLQGLPVHLILRSLLEKTSFNEAMAFINTQPVGCAGNIMIGDREGNYQDVEFDGEIKYLLDNTNPVFVHTNHYLQNLSLNTDEENLKSSYSRYITASELVKNLEDQTIDKMKSILADKSNLELPICRKYIQGKTMQDVGTVCTIVMDLQNEEMHITKGTPLKNEFSLVSLN
jgi:isopenicillin-N N-acyltransferase-like protein